MNHQVFLGLGVLALACWAIFRQTRTTEIRTGLSRFRLAAIYTVIGVLLLVTNGWRPPHGLGWLFLVGGALLSLIVGIARGLLTKIWTDAAGRPFRRGTWITVSLFVFTVLVKLGAGFLAAALGLAANAGAGEAVLTVALMTALQAEIVFRRISAERRCPTERPVRMHSLPSNSK